MSKKLETFVPENWFTEAHDAASVGLQKTSLGQALGNLFVSPRISGGVANFEMARDVGDGVYRSVLALDKLKTRAEGSEADTLADLFLEVTEKFADNPCLGRRQITSMTVKDNGFEQYVMGSYSWLTYKQVGEMVGKMSRGLMALGLESTQRVKIFADTKLEWQVTAQACFQLGVVVATSYANLGQEALVYGINQTESQVVFTDAVLVETLSQVLEQCPSVKHVVYFEDARPSSHEVFLSHEKLQAKFKDNVGSKSSAQLHSFIDVVKLGESQAAPTERPEVSPDDTAVIMYTSGSTGLPKGVMIAHRNMLGALAGVASMIPAMGPGDYYIAYLPLAHILEMIAETGLLSRGAALGYGTTKTITDASPCIKPGACRGDAPELAPTLMAAVPAIMDRIRHGVLGKVDEAGGIKAKLFHMAYDSKRKAMDQGLDAPFWNKLVFDALRTRLLGGRLRFMLSGGGPLSKATQDFMNVVFCCPVGQGYGLTETCGSGTIVWPNDRTAGRVGAPIPSAQFKLEDWEEGGYFVDPSKNEDKSVTRPRGEVLISGALVSQGYFMLPDKTAEAYFEDDQGVRWFRTGDIGEICADGAIRLIDRKKDLVKLAGGEYVSYGKLEPLIRDSKFVENAMVYADPEKSFCVCLVTKPQGKNPSESDVAGDVTRILKDAKVAKFEIPKKFAVVDEQWSPENDLATAALKLKRQNLQKFYANKLKELYA